MEETTARKHESQVGVPLAYVTVTPLKANDLALSSPEDCTPSWTSAAVKMQLLQLMAEELNGKSSLNIQWSKSDRSPNFSARIRSGRLFHEAGGLSSTADELLLYFRHSDPSAHQTFWPCKCVGYVVSDGMNCFDAASTKVCVSEATLVRLVGADNAKDRLTGELPETDSWDADEIFINQNPETVKELLFHLQRLNSTTSWVGTTPDALSNRHLRQQRGNIIRGRLRRRFQTSFNPKHESPPNQVHKESSTFGHRALIVHSPSHGDGKTCLVEVLLRKKLNCKRIHIIRAGPLLAKYGVYADVALFTIVHEIVVASAFDQEPVAVIFDHLDSFCCPSGPGDAASPALNGMMSYIKQLSQSLRRHGEIPFPSSVLSSMYNWRGQNGYALPVRFFLIGIVTCPDSGGENVRLLPLNSMLAARYRLPTRSAVTRLTAFRAAFRREDVKLSSELEPQLPFLTAGAVSARGADFCRVASLLKTDNCDATVESFQQACGTMINNATGSSVRFLSSVEHRGDGDGLFSSVGGNQEAKNALEEALALDPARRQHMKSFGIRPPTGVLLYGPPGTGKTLLARAVAELLRSEISSSLGGAFVSLSSTDIARAEVGSGEKMVAMAFETARLNAPAVVFIDEFQALFTERRNSGGSTRLTSTLLVCMDDLQRWEALSKDEKKTDDVSQSHRIVVLAATNTPWMVDKSFLRPGRFDRAVHVGLPGTAERRSIFEIHLKQMALQTHDIDSMCSRLAAVTDGFSGADIAAFARVAAVKCLSKGQTCVDESHFNEVIRDGLAPSSDEKLVEQIALWKPL